MVNMGNKFDRGLIGYVRGCPIGVDLIAPMLVRVKWAEA